MSTKLPKSIIAGRLGEQNSRVIYLDVSEELHEFPGTVPSLIYKRPGEEEAYPGTISFDPDTGTVSWVINSVITSVPGADGQVQLLFTSSNDVNTIIGRSIVIRLVVLESVTENSEEPPDPYDSWLAALQALAGTTTTNANAAAGSASNAASSASSASDSADDAEASASAAEQSATAASESASMLENISAEAVSVSGTTPTAEMIDGPDGKVILIGIPPGPQGPQGDPGKDGKDGKDGLVLTVNNQIPDSRRNVMIKAAHIATDIVTSGYTTVKSALETLIAKIVNFVGATEQAAGAPGMVPGPLAGDQDKFLKADGTWANPSGSGTVQSVNTVQPDSNGNVAIDADDIPSNVTGVSTSIEDDLTELSNQISDVADDVQDVADDLDTRVPTVAQSQGKYLRDDNTWATPSGGSGSTAAVVHRTWTIPASAWVQHSSEYWYTNPTADGAITSGMYVDEFSVTEDPSNPVQLGNVDFAVADGYLTIKTDVLPVAQWVCSIGLNKDGAAVLEDVSDLEGRVEDLEDAVSTQSDQIEELENSLTTDSEVIIQGVTVYRTGKIRMVNIDCDISNALLCTLPSKDKPNSALPFISLYTDSNNKYKNGYVNIDIYGRIFPNIYQIDGSASSVSSGHIKAVCIYIVN